MIFIHQFLLPLAVVVVVAKVELLSQSRRNKIIMARKLVLVGVIYLASVAAAGGMILLGFLFFPPLFSLESAKYIYKHIFSVFDFAVLDLRNVEADKVPEKKPNIVRDYVCLRDGELCHPDFARNRGLYVSCSNGVAWEQQCPKCGYHALNCPTRSLWFDGEKCDWASPKLASQPCIDRFQEFNNTENNVSEQEALLQSLLSPMPMPPKESANMEKNKWQMNSNMQAASPMYFKSPKSGDLVEAAHEDEEAVQVNNHFVSEPKDVKEASDAAEENENREGASTADKLRRKPNEGNYEPEFPSYLNADEGLIGNKVIRMSEPVYTLIDNPDGSGRQVLMRVSQPFVLEDPGRSILPNFNIISSFSDKE